MKDALRELSCLSLRLQSRSATIVYSYGDIAETLRVFEDSKADGGGKSTKAAQLACASEERLFKGVRLVNRGKPSIHVDQFLTAVADNLNARMSVENSDLDLVSHLKVLDSSYWPHDDSRITFGEHSVVMLFKRLKLECRPTVEEFRKLKDGKQPESHIKKLIAAPATYPGTSAGCEVVFLR